MMRSGVLIRGWLWREDTMRTACVGKHISGLGWPRHTASGATQLPDIPVRCNACPHEGGTASLGQEGAKKNHTDKPGMHLLTGMRAATARHCLATTVVWMAPLRGR